MLDPSGMLQAPTARVLVEGGHYPLGARSDEDEVVELPDGRRFAARTTPSTRSCFAYAVREAAALRERGISTNLGLLVGDLAVPGDSRPPGGLWALPASYLALLAEAGFPPADVCVYGESYARNQGKRRLLDPVRARKEAPEETYRREGWALFSGGSGGSGGNEEICLASDASLDWDGDVRVAMLSRGPTPLCPLVIAGLRRAVFQAGFTVHWALYAVADDPMIDRKLRSAAAAIAQLHGGRVGTQKDAIFLASEERPAILRTWEREELVAPGEQAFPIFVEAVRSYHPKFHPLQPT